MADTYGVVPADIAAELPGLFPGGFTASTVPTLAQVTSYITTADTLVTLRVTDDVGASPSASDKAAILAKRYVIEWVKAQVVRVVYAGNDPQKVDQAASPYALLATTTLTAIDLLGEQMIGTGESAPRVVTSLGAGSMPTRELVLDDTDLDGSGVYRSRY